MDTPRVISSAPSGQTPQVESPRWRLLIVVCVLALLVGAAQRLRALDFRLSRCFSVPGVTGLFCYLSGDLAKAAQYYRTHYESAGEPTYGNFSPDYVTLVTGDLKTAGEEAHRQIAADAEAVQPRLTLAEIALRQGAPDEALRWCEEALQRDTDQFDALLLASVAHARLQHEGDAVRCLHRALRHNRVENRVTSFLTALEAAGELAHRPGGQRPWCLLAQYYRYLRIMDPSSGPRAIAYAKRAIARGDHPADAWLAMAIIYDKREQRHKALEAIERAVAADPSHAEALRWASRLYGKAGEVLKELEFARRARAAAPEDLFYVAPLSYVLTEKLGDYRAGLELALDVLAAAPQDPKALQRVAWIYEMLGEAERAVTFYQEAVRADPRDADLWLDVGTVLSSLGRTDEALPVYQQAIALNPGSYEAYRRLGSLYHDRHEFPEAIAAYERALRLGEEDVGVLSNLCGLYYGTSQFQKAVDCFQQVLRRDPGEIRARRLLSEAQANLQPRSSSP